MTVRLAKPQLERIVLYIDDLDRCPPGRVVEVLEAVHLMLALDLFVVVVAVDARWLVQSLQYHHHDLFRTDAPWSPSTAIEEDQRRIATPIDYLDKIFQIPFVLLPPAPDVVGRYLRALLPVTSSPVEETGAPDSDSDNVDVIGVKGQGSDDIEGPSGEATASAHQPAEDDLADRASDDAVPADLRPPGLTLSPAEVEFMRRLGGFVPTPRAAKRMVNIYRLVRIGIPEGDLPAFTGDEKGGPYQAVQVLLAILTGSPAMAADVFRSLLHAPAADSLLTVLQEMPQQRSSKEQDNGPAPQRQLSWIETELTNLEAETGLSLTAADCQRWCPELARFSFYTRDLASAQARATQAPYAKASNE